MGKIWHARRGKNGITLVLDIAHKDCGALQEQTADRSVYSMFYSNYY